MVFILKIKELFNKNIECGTQYDGHVVSLLKKKYLYINKNIFVREGNACVVVYKGRVTDVVLSGKFKINEETIPETYARSKVEKLNAKGKRVRRIKVDIYSVNVSDVYKFGFRSDTPFKVKNSELGRIKGCIEGICTIKILDPRGIIKNLISSTGRVKTKVATKKISLYVGNMVNKIIQKNKISTPALLNNQEDVESMVNEYMQDALDKVGIFVTNVKLKAINFSKRYQAKVNEFLSHHKKNIKNFNINERFGVAEGKPKVEVKTSPKVVLNMTTMQRPQNTNNSSGFLICRVCKKKNAIGSKICINCGNKLI